MGLDISIHKIRKNRFDDTKPISEIFENDSDYVSEYRNIYEWLDQYDISTSEDENGRFYRIITKKDRPVLTPDKYWADEYIQKTFDNMTSKFIYIIKFDW